MNLPPAAARLRASRIAVQGGFTGGPPPGEHRSAMPLRILPYSLLYCIVLYCIVLYCIVLYRTVMHRTSLLCAVLQSFFFILFYTLLPTSYLLHYHSHCLSHCLYYCIFNNRTGRTTFN